jgi:serine protease Do
VTLSRAVIDMKDGEPWQYVGSFLTCKVSPSVYKWDSSQSEFKVDRFQSVLSEELIRAGFKSSRPQSLFDDAPAASGVEIGIRIHKLLSRICANIGPNRITMLMDAEWQVYDPVRREVIARVETSGGHERSVSISDPNVFATPDDIGFAVLGAFRENARALLASDAFRQAVLAPPSSVPPPGGGNSPITLVSQVSGTPRPIGDAPGSVVAVFTGSAMGSGFLVSEDGYILTNQHVVGAATAVRIRWSDGLESTGEVMRVDKRRDVALVKTSPRAGRLPLALRRGTPGVGEAVFAIGTPLDPSLQNTVTKGIVSANRILDGFAYIQSDVTIDHGNSGGPLLDDKGRVIGVTVIKIAPDDGQRGLNLFIPIGDALDFLALKTGP